MTCECMCILENERDSMFMCVLEREGGQGCINGVGLNVNDLSMNSG